MEEFIHTFAGGIDYLLRIKKPSAYNILFRMLQTIDKDTMYYPMTIKKRKDILDTVGIKPSTFAVGLMDLQDKRIVVGDKGDYYVNPYIFWKGNLDNRKKAIIKWDKMMSLLDDGEKQEETVQDSIQK